MIFFDGILRGGSKTAQSAEEERPGDYTTRMHGNMVDYFP